VVPAASTSAPSYPPAGVWGQHADPARLIASRGFIFAGFWLRFVAMLIDGAILVLALGILFLPLMFFTGFTANLEAFVHSAGQPNPAVLMAFIWMILAFGALTVLIR